MDISADKSRSDLNRSDPLSAVLQSVRDFPRRLIGFFVLTEELTEEEQSKAGVYVGGKRRDK